MRNKKVVKILCVILAAAMPVSSGVGVQAAQAGAVAATADQTDDVQNAAETSAEDSAQNADSDDLEGSIQYLDDSAQTNNSDAQQDGNISSDQTPQQDGNVTSDQASQDINGTIVQNEDSDNVTIKASDKPYLALGADLNDSQRATILSIMGIDAANLSNYDVVYVTNAEEHQYLDSYISSSQIGTRSLSSVVIVQRDKGSGLNISTTNINYCTVGMYKNALTTAGVTDADIIVFAGVKFMGESAKMLNPDKKVLMPDLNADCPMAHMASKAVIKKMKEEYEDLAVVCYINSTAELKTMADICVTSSNAVKIVRSLPNKNIFFIPDGNLGAYVKKQVPEKNIILNDGYCITHKRVTLKDVEKAREEHPNVPIIVHPECVNEVVEATDFAGSTSELIQYTVDNPSKEFVIGTELGVLHEMQLKSPDKTFYPLSDKLICMNMKKVSLEKVYDCLLNETNEVFVDEEVKAMAEKSLDRMLELAK